MCLESRRWRNSTSLELDLRKARWMCFGIAKTDRGLLFLIGNKHLKGWQQKEKIKNIGWGTRNGRVERRICHKSFANFNAWEASFSSNFVLGGLPNSKWFCCESDENSTCSWEMRPRVLSTTKILLNQLCQVLKDHKNPCLMNFVEASYQHCLMLVY